MLYYEQIVESLDLSIRRVGNRRSLVNEASVSAYIAPVSFSPVPVADVEVFDKLTDLFCGRMVNKPELNIEGQVSRKGRCEYSYVFFDACMVLLVELKLKLGSLTDNNFSNIVAQVMAEAEGRASFSSSCLMVSCIDLQR